MGETPAQKGVGLMQPNFQALKWMAIIVPALVLAALDLLRHTIFQPQLHTLPGFLATYLAIAVLAALFSFTVFRFIGRLQNRILEQNHELESLNNRLAWQNRELSALLSVGRVATSSFADDDLLNQLLDTVLDVAPADTVEVWLVDSAGDLDLRSTRGMDTDTFREIRHLKRGEGLPGEAVASRSAILVDKLSDDPRFRRKGVIAAGFKTYCALPLLFRNQPVGVLAVASIAENSIPDEDDVRLLEAIGDWLALAIENARLYHQVQDAAVLEERERIAREMHDGMAQVLGYINTQTLAVKRLIDNGAYEEARAELTRMEDIARELYTDIREGIIGLRSPSSEQRAFVDALRDYAEQYERMCGIPVEIRVADDEEPQIDSHSELQLIRIVQEALTNVRKHAEATRVSIKIDGDDHEISLNVCDNGRGFNPEHLPAAGHPRFGMQTMRERAEAVGGTLRIEPSSSGGACVRARVPVHRLEFLPQ